MIDPPDPTPALTALPANPQESPQPVHLDYRAPRDDVPEFDVLAPRKPFAIHIGVPIGIFHTAAIIFVTNAPGEWTHLYLSSATCTWIVILGLASPALLSLTIKKTRPIGMGILIALGTIALLAGCCLAMVK